MQELVSSPDKGQDVSPKSQAISKQDGTGDKAAAVSQYDIDDSDGDSDEGQLTQNSEKEDRMRASLMGVK